MAKKSNKRKLTSFEAFNAVLYGLVVLTIVAFAGIAFFILGYSVNRNTIIVSEVKASVMTVMMSFIMIHVYLGYVQNLRRLDYEED
jgi:uncharacterized membrane-anchored protein